jgi:hypothetical protein
LVPTGGALLAAILAAAYSWIDLHWRVYDIVSVLQLLIFTGAVAIGVGRLTLLAKCRNAMVARLLGIGVGVFAVYASWVCFEIFVLQEDPKSGVLRAEGWAKWFFSPRQVWNLAVEIDGHGTFTLSGDNVTGFPLWGIWLAEAAVVIGASALLVPGMIEDRVFCERCLLWTKKWPKPIFLFPTKDGAAESLVAQGDFSALGHFAPAQKTTNPRLSIIVHQCPGCAETAAWTFSREVDVQGKHGVQIQTTPLSKARMLTAEQAAALTASFVGRA